MNKKIKLQDLGKKDYKETWDYQEVLFKEIVDQKIQNRKHKKPRMLRVITLYIILILYFLQTQYVKKIIYILHKRRDM